jgi:hypothetical protein
VITKLGLIQSRGLGDIIIALPIAKYYHDRGIRIHWPIDERFLPSFSESVDYVNFIPFRFEPDLDGFLRTPIQLLKEAGCEANLILYSTLTSQATGASYCNKALFNSLKFDEYKYAVSGVPFGEKWNLSIKRNHDRETALYRELVTSEDYVVVHTTGSNCKAAFELPARCKGLTRIEVTERTPNIFDWLMVLERARELFLIDSCFSNAVEQLNFANEKSFILRSNINFTPVLRNKWKFFGDSAPAAK